ncbi:uncharacterized protein GO595_010442 [Histomonas meleagridis]|uniref:uncharacterized protein n=1 Tax=Histomonas meleagridis TaxID=135588 RepID=UPI00355999BF|nr:hypothetical protein GO595_010442 [Histomonas meleagridis]
MFFLIFLPFLFASEKNVELPFDDQEPENTTQEGDPNEVPPKIKRFNYLPISTIFKIREIIMIIIVLIFISFYIYGRKSIQNIQKRALETIISSFKEYYAVIPQRFVSYSNHRFDAYVTGRTSHLGCLITFNITKRCDPIGFVYDKLLKRNSTVSFEFLISPNQKVPLLLHISSKSPKFAECLKLKRYDMINTNLICLYDLPESLDEFLPMIEEFIKTRPNVLRLVEISDANRFDLKNECRFVVKLEFNIDKNEEIVFSDEIIKFGVSLADKLVLFEVPQEALSKMENMRKEIVMEARTEFGIPEPKKKTKTE